MGRKGVVSCRVGERIDSRRPAPKSKRVMSTAEVSGHWELALIRVSECPWGMINL